MGHLVHPIASRLGISTFWNVNSIVTFSKNYTFFSLEDLFFQNLFSWFYRFLEKDNFLFTHVISSRVFDRILFCCLIYNSNVDQKWLSFFKKSFRKLKDTTDFSLFKHPAALSKKFDRRSSVFSKRKKKDYTKSSKWIYFFKQYKYFKHLYLLKKYRKKVWFDSTITQDIFELPLLNFSMFSKKISFSKRKKIFIAHKRYYRTKKYFFRKKYRRGFDSWIKRSKSLRGVARVLKNKKPKVYKFYFRAFNFKLLKLFFISKNVYLKKYFNNYYARNSNKIKFQKKFQSILKKKKQYKKKRLSFFKRFKRTSVVLKKKERLKKRRFFRSFKQLTHFFQFFKQRSVSKNEYSEFPMELFSKVLNRNIYGFWKSVSDWYLHSFKSKLLGFFINNFLNIRFKISFLFFYLTSGAFSASLICKYIINRLHQGALLFDILKPLMLKLVSFERMSGFKISCAGRFSRRQIAAYSWQRRGELPLNSFGRVIDYHNGTAFLNNSVCGLKVWLCFPEKFLKMRKRGFFFSGRSFCV